MEEISVSRLDVVVFGRWTDVKLNSVFTSLTNVDSAVVICLEAFSLASIITIRKFLEEDKGMQPNFTSNFELIELPLLGEV